MGEGDRHVLHLPDEESEVRDDDARSEGRQRNPAGITDEIDGEDDLLVEAGEPGAAIISVRLMRAVTAMNAAASAKFTSTMAMA